MPDKVAPEKVALLRAYGAEVVTTPTAVERDSPESYYSVADRLTREMPNAFQPNQYFNPMNPRTHYETTGPEIWEQTGGRITHFVAGVGTGGTISGVGQVPQGTQPSRPGHWGRPGGQHLHQPDAMHTYKVEGVGEDFWPGTFDPTMVDEWVKVSDRDSFLAARRVTREEGHPHRWLRRSRPPTPRSTSRARLDDPEALVVVLLPDSGRGYLSKIYSDDWMRENGFLSRFTQPARVGTVVAERSGETPTVVAVSCDQTVARRHRAAAPA